MEKRFNFPDGGYIDVRKDAHCPFALYTVLNSMAHKCYFEIPKKISFDEACAFVENWLSQLK